MEILGVIAAIVGCFIAGGIVADLVVSIVDFLLNEYIDK